jgi:hypothetical protein
MIVVKLMGGLGNQCFQYVYGLALKERGYQVEYDKSSLIEGTHREYSLDYFGIEAKGMECSPRYYEGSLAYNPIHLAPPDPSTVMGYFQSEKYFVHISEKVRAAFKFQNFDENFNTIAIHVRRQDYVNLQHFHGMPGLNYYREGVAYIRRKVGLNLPVRVFSDDRSWCQENFPSDFTIMNGGNKYEDLKLMAACDYHVIANSSYSWWGAWLSRDRITVAPKQWFSDTIVDSSDIVPERWIKL